MQYHHSVLINTFKLKLTSKTEIYIDGYIVDRNSRIYWCNYQDSEVYTTPTDISSVFQQFDTL